MKKGLLILIPLIAVATYSSRYERTPTLPVAVVPTHAVVAEVKPTPSIPVPEQALISFSPISPIQGEPVLVKVSGIGTSTVTSLRFNGSAWPVFTNTGKTEALLGLDLRLAPGTYPVTATLSDGRVLKQNLVVKVRKLVTAPLGIPESLGGNTTSSEETLVNTLVEEGKIISAVTASSAKLWSGAFRFPLDGKITITDVYGYSRSTGTGATTLAHKGTDFRAAIGTPVHAINSGRVAYTGFLRNYGNVIIVDHGTGLLSIYMHLSQINVSVGQGVSKSDVLGLSGDTGYVLGPHLHLTIRIGGISVDPMKFYELLGS